MLGLAVAAFAMPAQRLTRAVFDDCQQGTCALSAWLEHAATGFDCAALGRIVVPIQNCETNMSPILKLFLSRIDDLIARVSKKTIETKVRHRIRRLRE